MDSGGFEKSIHYEKSGPVIDGMIVGYAFNDRYIVALRQPRGVVREKNGLRSHLENKCEYWMIDTKTHGVMGVYIREEYASISEKVGIPLSELSNPVSMLGLGDRAKFCIE